MKEEIIIKILNDSATDAEKYGFFQDLKNDSVLRESYYLYKTLYTVSNYDRAKNAEIQSDSFERLWKKLNRNKRFRISEFWYRYAAIFIIALILGFLSRQFISQYEAKQSFVHQIEYTSEKGSVSTIHLEDGSNIWLSSSSKIIILKSPSGEMRVKLDGEAYFDMIPNSERKLVVDLGYLKVRDIGTKFNIRAYSSEGSVFTSLVEGQIELSDSEGKSRLSMKPVDYLQFDKQTKRMAVSQRDPAIATAWKDGKFVFIDRSLAEICHELENWYNVEIIIRNKSLANTRYTSVIKRTTTVSMVLKMLSLTDKINYQITDRKEARDIVTID